MVKPGIERV